jgi:diguanylate cyclase (GGDEF)-like protein
MPPSTRERRKTGGRWGWSFIVIALAMAVGTGVLAVWYGPQRNPFVYRWVLPTAGLVLSLLALCIGHISFPRVQNLKVYLLGYLSGITGIAIMVLYLLQLGDPDRVAPGTFHALYLLVFVDFCSIVFVPSFVKYGITRTVTLSLSAVHIVLIVLGASLPSVRSVLGAVEITHIRQVLYWVPFVWGALVFVAAWRRFRDEFFLGGVITGAALIYAIGWLTVPHLELSVTGLVVYAAAAMLYIEAGTVAHWFFRMEHRISYDPLLDIYNRTYCSRVISERSRLNTAPPFAVAMVDIDHFKQVNDTYGHQAGDTILYQTAQAIREEVIPEAIVCRYGGEEIVVFFKKTGTNEAARIMERVRARIEAMKTDCGRKKVTVTVSIGISHKSHPKQQIEQVVKAADKALYRAKEGGRNRIKTSKTPVPGRTTRMKK